MFLGPLIQKTEVIAVDVINTADCLLKSFGLKLLSLGSLSSARRSFRPFCGGDRQPKIIGQLCGGFIRSKIKKLRGEINHVAFFLTAETDEILIDLHARIPVIMKRTAGHAGTVHFDAVTLCSLAGADLFFDLGVNSQISHLLSFRK